MKLPTEPQSPNLSPHAFNWLFMGATDGIGKSSMLASVSYKLQDNEPKPLLILDPDQSCKALPGYILDVLTWRDALEVVRMLKSGKEDLSLYSGIGVDNLNIFHDKLFEDFVKREKHPGDANDMGKTWNKLTREWVSWLRDLRMASPGLFIATCHTNIIELKIKNTPFNRYVPAIPGGGPRGAYRQTMEMFDIIGFMTKEGTEEATKPPKDARADALNIVTKEQIVIHFLPCQYWEAKDNSRQLPHKVALSEDWKEDWTTILSHWGKET
jgi:hypothetical protein